MNEYEEKQEARKERYQERAENARQECEDRYQASRRSVEHIPFGQPILIGHHSEKRHRSALKKVDTHMRKSCEARDRAKHYDRKADGVGRGGISSDDPDALIKLRDQLATHEATREAMKYLNMHWRKHGELPANIAPELEAKAKAFKFLSSGGDDVPFASYQISNLGANIRRLKKRINELEAEATREPARDIETEHIRIYECADDNRIYFEFRAGRPTKEVCEIMRRNGWRWKRSINAWSRHLNNAGRYKAEYTAAAVGKILDEAATAKTEGAE